MSKIIFLTILFSSSFSFAQEYVYERFVSQSYILEKIINPHNEVLVFEEFFPVPFRHIEKKVMDKFKADIKLRSEQYVAEARERNIYLQNPTDKYIFSFHYYGNEAIPNMIGHCNREANLIYLEENFQEQTFYHELGHCDFDYSHKEDERLVDIGYSPYVMSYNFNYDRYGLSGKEVLDVFFDFDQHTYLDTREGKKSHLKMNAQIREFKRKRRAYVKN